MRRLLRLPRLWFSLDGPVDRFDYAVSGLLLVAVKYLLDDALFRAATGRHWSPWSYVQPSFGLRFEGLSAGSYGPMLLAMAAIMVPFLWIGASMTVRRCLDAGIWPGTALVFFFPIVNWLFMVVLCFLPTKRTSERTPVGGPPMSGHLHAGVASIAWGAGIGLGMILISVQLLDRYGVALFVGAPFALGAVCAFVYARRTRAELLPTLGIVALALLVTTLAIVLFALEGLICLAMAAPIAFALAALGCLVGWTIATGADARGATLSGFLACLPLMLAGDVVYRAPAERVATTSIEIDAPIEEVFEHVISFPDLPAPNEWWFRAGIAYPTGATLDGQGVGAIRQCRFSTGTFVEPITAWDEPTLLAFEVVAQPLPMVELSPWDRVWAPHLETGFVSRRGEFRLVRSSDGRTRLEGRTWYELGLEPTWYWGLWSDAIVHAIHRRVLEHVETLAEQRSSP